MELTRRKLTMYVYTEMTPRRERTAMRWLTAALLGSVKYAREPVVTVVTDESGKELGRMAWGEVSDDLMAMVDSDFPLEKP